MSLEINLTIVAMVASIVAATIALATFVRTGRWKASEAGKEIAGRLDDHATRLTRAEARLEECPTTGDINGVTTRLTRVETQLGEVATRADIAGLQSTIAAVQREIGNTEASISRIETFLLEGRR